MEATEKYVNVDSLRDFLEFPMEECDEAYVSTEGNLVLLYWAPRGYYETEITYVGSREIEISYNGLVFEFDLDKNDTMIADGGRVFDTDIDAKQFYLTPRNELVKTAVDIIIEAFGEE